MGEFKNTVEKEYMMLREEIMHYLKQRDTIAQSAYTITIAMFAAAFAADNSWVVLCAIPFLIPMSLKAAECGEAIGHLATYLSNFIEPYSNFSWETNHIKFYELNERSFIEKIIYLCSRLDFAFLTLVSSLLFWGLRDFRFFIKGKLVYGILLIIVQIVLIIAEAYLGVVYSNLKAIKDNKAKDWSKVEKHYMETRVVESEEFVHHETH